MTKVRTVHISKACREWEWREEQGREKRHENKNTYRVKELMVRVIRTTIHKCNRWVCIGFLSTPCVLCCVVLCVRACVFFHFSWLFSSAFIDKTAIIIMFLFSFFSAAAAAAAWWWMMLPFYTFYIQYVVSSVSSVCVYALFFILFLGKMIF